MRKGSPIDPSVHAAALGAAALIAHQVGGKATRDALFFSHFDVAALPWMVMLASVLAVVGGLAGARLMSSVSPSRLIPRAFLASAVLLVLEWGFSYRNERVAAVFVYLQMAALGPALISGFWSLLGELFDPHSAKKQFGRVIAAGTFGGVIGGLIAERVGTTFGVVYMLPVLAALHIICAFLTGGRGLKPATTYADSAAGKPVVAGFSPREPYLRQLALLIVVTTIGAGLLDYVFKARAVAAHESGADLLRFFAIFYTALGVLTFLVQITLNKVSLERLGLGGTIGTLSAAVGLGSFAGILLPGLASSMFARGSEAILRSSLFRSGYELFYAAVPRRDRRETKPIVDVAFERFGDMLAGMIISVILIAASGRAIGVMLTLAVITGIAGLWISRQLHYGYVKALEKNLLNQSIHIDISDIRDSTTRATVIKTLANVSPAPLPNTKASVPERKVRPTTDAIVQRVAELRSPDASVVRRVLERPLDPTLTAHVISLLAWNPVADDAVVALQKIAGHVTGQLVDALLDPAQEFAVRRRIPRVLAISDNDRAVNGLIHGLFDKRFEVRFQSGRALAQIQDRRPEIELDGAAIIDAVLSELSVDREVWNSRSIIDAGESDMSSVSFEHVFRLLSLILPREPLKIAYRGLNSGDRHLKGMALEYLESVLPEEVRKRIWPMLEVA